MGLFSRMPSPKDAERARANLAADFKTAERASEERSARFWNNHANSNGADSSDES